MEQAVIVSVSQLRVDPMSQMFMAALPGAGINPGSATGLTLPPPFERNAPVRLVVSPGEEECSDV